MQIQVDEVYVHVSGKSVVLAIGRYRNIYIAMRLACLLSHVILSNTVSAILPNTNLRRTSNCVFRSAEIRYESAADSKQMSGC